MKQQLLNLIQWVKTFIRERFNYNPEQLPFYITIFIAIILFTLGLNIFVELTDDLAENELEKYDKQVTSFILSFRSHMLTSFFSLLTHLGSRIAYIILIFVFTVFYVIRFKSWKYIIQTVLVLILSSLSNIVLKRIFNRSRPSLEHLVSVNELSYPSGHSMSAMAFYGFIAYLCLRSTMPRWIKTILVVLLTLLILMIGISRVYLGVHYPSDVAAGFIGGLIWITFCIVIFNIIDLMRERKRVSSLK